MCKSVRRAGGLGGETRVSVGKGRLIRRGTFKFIVTIDLSCTHAYVHKEHAEGQKE